MYQKNEKSVVTDELLHAITKARRIDDFLQAHESDMKDVDLKSYLYNLLEHANLTIPLLIEKASISKSLAYQIFSGQRTPNRNLILRISLVMKLSLDETQRLLRLAKKGELYPRIQRDAAIIFCITNKYSLIDTNELLENLGEAILIKEE
ncbi:MAG: hypothetical protein QM644_00380 [Mobilitalea sp.]